MKWNYRIMRHTDAGGRQYYAVHETYYGDAGEVMGSTEEAASVMGETLDEVREELDRMLRALDYPVIEIPYKPVQDGGCGND